LKSLILHIFILLSTFSYGQLNNKLLKKATEAKAFCKKNNMNTEYCFLIDFSIHSGKNRFFIYNFKTNTVVKSGLACHGIGKNSTTEKPIYSNEVGSNCSSLGKYKIGKRAYSNWGINIHYKMHGLESTNSNAFKRQVVLHSYSYVSETELSPNHLTMGWSQGCPVLANGLMKTIDGLLLKTKKPTLIWIYE
jgi:hypothetical protein